MPDTDQPLSGQRILVVEDEFLIAMEVKRWLLAAGAEVAGPVSSIDQALDLIEDNGLDAAVLDVSLARQQQVYPVADKLGALGVPYLFATANVRVSDAPEYRDRPRLPKPFVEAELVRALGGLMR